MSSETSMVAAGFRLQEWAAQIRECQSRPAGMSVASWCANNGISKANYYYRLRRDVYKRQELLLRRRLLRRLKSKERRLRANPEILRSRPFPLLVVIFMKN